MRLAILSTVMLPGLLLGLAGGAHAQGANAQGADAQGAAPGCAQAVNTPASTARPATAPAPGRDGTAPGNAGSTGWSGGTGGSFIGTNPAGAVASSPTWQPPTARGLDPIAGMVRPTRC